MEMDDKDVRMASAKKHSSQSPAFRIINGVKWAYLTRGHGRAVLCQEKAYTLFKDLERKARVDYHCLYLHKQVVGLSANIGTVNNLVSKFTSLKRKLKLDGGELHYEMRGGDVLLTGLTVDWDYRRNNKKARGLYTVINDGVEYPTESADSITTEHVAINGLVKDLRHAAWMMPAFVNAGYPSKELKKKAEYTLFYNDYNGFLDADYKCIQDSTGLRGGTQAARQLAASIEMAAREKREVNWTVHERGCAIFKQALRLLSPQHDYAKQTVFYANDVVNTKLVDQHRARVGMKLSSTGFISNDWSVHQGLVAGNWITDPIMLWQNGNKGGAIEQGTKALALAGGGIAFPGMWGAPAWAMGLVALLGANLFASYSNQGVIRNTGDALNHYLFKRGRA